MTLQSRQPRHRQRVTALTPAVFGRWRPRRHR